MHVDIQIVGASMPSIPKWRNSLKSTLLFSNFRKYWEVIESYQKPSPSSTCTDISKAHFKFRTKAWPPASKSVQNCSNNDVQQLDSEAILFEKGRSDGKIFSGVIEEKHDCVVNLRDTQLLQILPVL